ncbi:MAG: DNA methylase [Ruminococcaceae bacterium]|nr:DNA methylase [Oscillospiraceae bacterium]
MNDRVYVAIDLKSFYASVECVDRGLDPLTTHLVVADKSRTDKTICLAVSPSLKSYGIPGRPRLFEVVQRVREVNAERERRSPEGKLYVRIYDDTVTRSDPTAALDYIVAPPRMARYKKVSTDIYKIYLKYVAPEDIHIYSIDEVLMDVTDYLTLHKMTARELTMTMIRDVLRATGITATAGIGTNLFLAKVAMDVVAKHIPADPDGVRIAELDEMSFRRQLWTHEPITDIWRVGPGIAKKLAAHGMHTMGDVARCSAGRPEEYYNEDLLYELFGINAELLIDHAWGWEPCTMKEIKAYRSESSSLGSGQVLQHPYDFEGGRLIVREMTDLLALDLVEKGLVTDQLVLTVGYDVENLADPVRGQGYRGEVTVDRYGRKVPKHAHGTESLPHRTSSTRELVDAAMRLYDRIVDPRLLVRRVYVVAGRVLPETDAPQDSEAEQLDLFTNYAQAAEQAEKDAAALEREKKRQAAILAIRQKYGKNAILKGMNFEDGAMTRERNGQVGGHRAGTEDEL